jgi:condensin complex subunit 3
VSHIINTLDSIDDELYHLVRQGLLKRIRDKEPTIRIQAVLGLGRLAGNEVEEQQDDEDSDNDDAGGLLEKLLEVLQHDTSAEVRRSLLLNLPLTPGTLPYLLERARDLDPATRRALYSRLLPTLGDFRHLSLSMREKLLRWGLRDRDENVRKAAGRLFRERWIEDCVGPRAEEDGAIAGQAAPPSTPALLELLERIDIVNSGVDNGIALEAMSDFWGGRPDYRDEVTFDDAFWDNLTPENIFLARSFNDFCRQGPGGTHEVLLEEKMPEVTKLAFYLERYAKALLENIKRTSDEEGAEEEETVEQEFIVEQLLHIALSLDYSDEVGRRKMFTLLRETLAIADLPDEATRLVIEVLRGVCGRDAAGEREFCRVVLEGVAEVHDNIEEDFDESFHSARSEISDMTPSRSKRGRGITSNSSDDSPGGEEDEAKIIREIMINMKCLHIAQCMLQNVEGDLQQNVHLVTMLNNLVVPAVRSHEAPIRERGIFCLGLCCLLDKVCYSIFRLLSLC